MRIRSRAHPSAGFGLSETRHEDNAHSLRGFALFCPDEPKTQEPVACITPMRSRTMLPVRRLPIPKPSQSTSRTNFLPTGSSQKGTIESQDQNVASKLFDCQESSGGRASRPVLACFSTHAMALVPKRYMCTDRNRGTVHLQSSKTSPVQARHPLNAVDQVLHPCRFGIETCPAGLEV